MSTKPITGAGRKRSTGATSPSPRSSRRSLPPRPRHSVTAFSRSSCRRCCSIRRHHWYWRRWAHVCSMPGSGSGQDSPSSPCRLWARSACSSPPTHRCCSSGRSACSSSFGARAPALARLARAGTGRGLGLLSKYTMAAFLPSALLVMLMLPRGSAGAGESTSVARAASGARRLRPQPVVELAERLSHSAPHRRHHPCR